VLKKSSFDLGYGKCLSFGIQGWLFVGIFEPVVGCQATLGQVSGQFAAVRVAMRTRL
jgi:hypothetical protein